MSIVVAPRKLTKASLICKLRFIFDETSGLFSPRMTSTKSDIVTAYGVGLMHPKRLIVVVAVFMMILMSLEGSGLSIESIEGNGALKVNYGKLNLAPGIYAAKVTIWDKNKMHPYAIRKDNVFRIEVKGLQKRTSAVILKKMNWEIVA